MTQRIEIVVPSEIVRIRLDEFLFRQFGGLSKMYLRNVVRDEKCEVNGRNENLGYKLRSGDLIEIECDFRAPMAMVRWQDYFWLIDSDGYKLPEQYTAEQAADLVLDNERRPHLRIIDGVAHAPVESGQQWPGADLAAGLELARLLFGQRYVDEIVKIDISNFSGRIDPREAHLTLVTRDGTEVRWGRPISAKDAFIEIAPAKKLEAMQQIFTTFNRVDAGQPWVDIRFDKVTYPAAAGTQ